MEIDMRSLPDGTKFKVLNGNWTGSIFSRDGKKYMHIDETGRDVVLTGKENNSIRILNN